MSQAQTHFPVIVTTAATHVLWIAAEDQADAVSQLRDSHGADLDQLLDVDTVVEADWSVRAVADLSDARMVASHGPATDAHVRNYRLGQDELARAACAAAGHTEHRRPVRDGVICALCFVTLETAAAAA